MRSRSRPPTPPHCTYQCHPLDGGGQRLATRPIEKSNKLIWDFAFISFSFFGIPFFWFVFFEKSLEKMLGKQFEYLMRRRCSLVNLRW